MKTSQITKARKKVVNAAASRLAGFVNANPITQGSPNAAPKKRIHEDKENVTGPNNSKKSKGSTSQKNAKSNDLPESTASSNYIDMSFDGDVASGSFIDNNALLFDDNVESGCSLTESQLASATVVASVPLSGSGQSPPIQSKLALQPSFDSAYHSVSDKDEKIKKMEEELQRYKAIVASSNKELVSGLIMEMSTFKQGVFDELRNVSNRLQTVERELPSDLARVKVSKWLDGCDFTSSSYDS